MLACSCSSITPLHNSVGLTTRGFKTKFRFKLNSQLSLPLGPHDLAALAHNKVLVAAGVSAAIGQLSKPFTGCVLYNKPLDLFSAFQAGGFPSTHSSAVIATATSLALERGLSDSTFGLTLVYAGLVMCDAQGVRREVGNHAKALNQVLPKVTVEDSKDSEPATPSAINGNNYGSLLPKDGKPLIPNPTNAPPHLLLNADKKATQTDQTLASLTLASAELEEVSEKIPRSSAPLKLKESVGHTELEVVAGALLGLFVALVADTVI